MCWVDKYWFKDTTDKKFKQKQLPQGYVSTVATENHLLLINDFTASGCFLKFCFLSKPCDHLQPGNSQTALLTCFAFNLQDTVLAASRRLVLLPWLASQSNASYRRYLTLGLSALCMREWQGQTHAPKPCYLPPRLLYAKGTENGKRLLMGCWRFKFANQICLTYVYSCLLVRVANLRKSLLVGVSVRARMIACRGK